jgi:hypothetical protein
MRHPYQSPADRLEARRAGAMDLLGAVLFAACIATPVALWWFRII